MTDPASGQTHPRPPLDDPDAHGQAALLLVESLLYALVEKDVLSIDDVRGVVRSACEVKRDIADEAVEARATAERSLQLLARIADSLAFDR